MSFFLRASQFRPGDSRLGRSFAFAPDVERDLAKKHIDAIQQFAQKEVSADDVHVRGMLLCNSQRDYYYSRFTRDALAEIVEMVPGAPVMTGHDYRLRPDARFFDAKVSRIEDPSLPKRDQYWAECLYYVPKDTTGDEYVRRVDLGVYREVSIGFRLASAPCSVCSKQIWACEHIPGEVYAKSGICEWGMEGITSVLEGSQVFRGGQKDTSNFIPDGAGSVDPARIRYRSALVDGTDDLDARMIVVAKKLNLLDRCAEPFGLTVEEFLASDVAAKAIGFGALFGKRGERANTQAVVCAKTRFSTVSRAKRWVRDNDFRADRSKETDSGFVFEQFAESLGESGSFRGIALDEGVEARVCRVRQAEENPEGRSIDTKGDEPESVETWLARSRASE